MKAPTYEQWQVEKLAAWLDLTIALARNRHEPPSDDELRKLATSALKEIRVLPDEKVLKEQLDIALAAKQRAQAIDELAGLAWDKDKSKGVAA